MRGTRGVGRLSGLPEYTRRWAEKTFGPEHATEIAHLVTTYSRFNGRRKPELLAPETYSLTNYREAETVVADYYALAERAVRVSTALPAEYHDAFYQLVLHPIQASANLNDLYVTVATNRHVRGSGARRHERARRSRTLVVRA